VKQTINKIRLRTNGSLISIDELILDLPHINPSLIEAVLKRMEAENMIMYRERMIILI
jgi:hypothetical protein